MKRGRFFLAALLAASLVAWLAVPGLGPVPRAFCVVVVVALPALALLQAKLLESLDAPLPRLAVYRSSALTLVLLAAVTLAVAGWSGLPLAALGLRRIATGPFAGWAAATALVGVGLTTAGHVLGIEEAPLLRQLLPVTMRERIAFAGVSLVAGTMEELVFRGFLITVLAVGTHSGPLAVVLSAAAFGVLHAYQRPAGALRAGTLGLLLTVPLWATGSLYPSMAAHTAIDLYGGLWFGPRYFR